MSNAERQNPLPYGLFEVQGTIWGKCSDCGQLIRFNKPILGSLHFCLSPIESVMKDIQDYANRGNM